MNVDVKKYLEDGYLVVSNILSSSEVDEVTSDIIKIARGEYPCKLNMRNHYEGLSDNFILRDINNIRWPHTISPVIQKYMKHKNICNVLDKIVGSHLYNWNGGTKSMLSQLFCRSPKSVGQAWHQDEYWIPTRDRSMTGVWIALDDVTIDNGCMWVIPKSHKEGIVYPMRKKTKEECSHWDEADVCYNFPNEETKSPAEMKKGDAIFWNGYTVHGSFKNTTEDLYRRALVFHYMNSSSQLIWKSKGNDPDVEYVYNDENEYSEPVNDCREVVQITGEDPLWWKPTYNNDKCVIMTQEEIERLNKK
tara:strand:- start:587 stop:1501 length:915 start_codon:yes stop_codon:yes gene_type:complete